MLMAGSGIGRWRSVWPANRSGFSLQNNFQSSLGQVREDKLPGLAPEEQDFGPFFKNRDRGLRCWRTTMLMYYHRHMAQNTS